MVRLHVAGLIAVHSFDHGGSALQRVLIDLISHALSYTVITHPTWFAWPQFSSGFVSLMNISMHSPSLFTSVTNFHCILLPGYVFWDMLYTARQVTSPVNAMANRSQIIVLMAQLYRLVIITTYRKVCHFEQNGTCHSSLMIDNDFRLLDPKGMDDRTSYSSNVTSRRANFKQDVVNRDRCCVMTSTTLYDACHLMECCISHLEAPRLPFYRSATQCSRLQCH